MSSRICYSVAKLMTVVLLSTYALDMGLNILTPIFNARYPSTKNNPNKGVNTTIDKHNLYDHVSDDPQGLFGYMLTLNKKALECQKNEDCNDKVDPNTVSNQMKTKYKDLVVSIKNLRKENRNINEAIDKGKVPFGTTNISISKSKSSIDHIISKSWYNLESIDKRTKNCIEYFSTFPTLLVHDDLLNSENRAISDNFPLAFSHMLHKDTAIFEIFLALYFRPNNFHCIHVDKKATYLVIQSVENLVRCYKTKINHGEIFIIPQNESISVRWGEISVLDADIKCQSRLLKFNQEREKGNRWKYTLSVAGSELPLVSYFTLHDRISTHLKTDLSAVESFETPEYNRWRFEKKKKHEVGWIENGKEIQLFEIPDIQVSKPGEKKFSRSLSFKIYKGMKNAILSARDTEFLINHPVSRHLYEWFKEVDFPEEHFLPTLIRITVDPNTLMLSQKQSSKFIYKDPGGLTYTDGNTLNGMCPRYTQWMPRYECMNKIDCYGECIHGICNLHSLDLSRILDSATDCLMLNKFNFDVDPLAITMQFFNILYLDFMVNRNLTSWYIIFDKIVNLDMMQ